MPESSGANPVARDEIEGNETSDIDFRRSKPKH
jgi:hypothetical protein